MFTEETEIEFKISGLGINLKGELLDPRLDYVFKRIFLSETDESKIALTGFLNSILDVEKEIVDLTILTPENPVDNVKQKKIRWDIRVMFNDGEQATVEMELYKKDNFTKRSVHGISRLYSSQHISGKAYSELKKCYFVSVMGYNILSDEFEYLNSFSYRDKKGRLLSDATTIIYLELNKISHLLDKDVSTLTDAEMWMLFLRYASFDEQKELLSKISQRNGGIEMAAKILGNISQDEYERENAWYILREEIDRESERIYWEKKGRTGGIEEGILYNKIETAKSLLKEGFTQDVISRITGLSPHDIASI